MSVSLTSRATLLAHPTTGSTVVRGIEAEVALGLGGLAVSYMLQADLSRIRTIAEFSGAGRVDGLWRHTCFELFVSSGTGPGYVELNFSPAKQWAAYQFDGYRAGMKPLALPQPPEISTRALPHQLELRATLPLPETLLAGERAKVAVAAVIEDESGSLSYWSARHPPGRPDFHHAESFFGLSP